MTWVLLLWPPIAFALVLAGASAWAMRRGAASSEAVAAYVEARVPVWLAITLAVVGLSAVGLVTLDAEARRQLVVALRAGVGVREIGAGLAVGVGMAALYFGGLERAVRWAQATVGDYVPAGSTAVLGTRGLAFFVANLALAPVVEEVWYRGLLFDALGPGLGLATAAVVGCAAFGLFHWPGGAWYVLLTGALVGGACWALRAWSGGLAAPIAAHLALNVIEYVVLVRRARRASSAR